MSKGSEPGILHALILLAKLSANPDSVLKTGNRFREVTGAEARQDFGGTQDPSDGALHLKPGCKNFQKRIVLCMTAVWLDRQTPESQRTL